MPVVYCLSPGTKISQYSDHLIVEPSRGAKVNNTLPRKIPLIEVEHLVLDSGVQIPLKSLSGLLRKGIPILLTTHGFVPAGNCLPATGKYDVLEAHALTRDNYSWKLEISRALIDAKIRNSKRVIQKLAFSRNIQWDRAFHFNMLAKQIKRADQIDVVRGIEGAAAGYYYREISPFFGKEYEFKERSRRPPRDPANSIMSYTYTILANELTAALNAEGLCPGWGALHETFPGRQSLAYDLLEPFRAPVADVLAIDLLNRRKLKLEDFDKIERGFYLTQEARKTFFHNYEIKMERTFVYEVNGQRTSIRKQLKEICRSLKNSITQQTTFQPFILN
tara:strand:+ start:271 stop:1272 length:1002 start_codon:yes stop_codon:yes gene_type:complete